VSFAPRVIVLTEPALTHGTLGRCLPQTLIWKKAYVSTLCVHMRGTVVSDA
jgi:hypothetical protein